MQGFAQSLLRRMSHRSSMHGCGVTFEIVSNIPGVREGQHDLSLFKQCNELQCDLYIYIYYILVFKSLRSVRLFQCL